MVKVQDIAYVAYKVPDLDKMEKFLTDFGLYQTARTDTRLYMRGVNGAPYHYVAIKSNKAAFHAVGIAAASYEDLETLVAEGHTSEITKIEAPGGGHCAVLTSPDGYRFEVVHGIDPLEEKSLRQPLVYNYGTQKNRMNRSQRPPKGIVDVLRLGHCAMTVKNAAATAQWLNTTLGFKTADELTPVNKPEEIVGVFMYCDQGEEFVDHHTLFVSQSDDIHIHHCAFEVQDIDAVMSGHDYLISRGCNLEVGVGRHMAGSQVFDYWIDPFGMRIEHYADGDVVNNAYQPKKISGTPEGVTQWGPVPPEKFFS